MQTKMYLHEAIGKALEQMPSKMGSYKEISKTIAEQGYYLRKDGYPPASGQIAARVNNYQQYFEKIPGGARLINPIR
jgi:hypothetical protein